MLTSGFGGETLGANSAGCGLEKVGIPNLEGGKAEGDRMNLRIIWGGLERPLEYSCLEKKAGTPSG